MRKNIDLKKLYANDPPKLLKCFKYAVSSLLFWFLVMYVGFVLRDVQCARFVFNYAVFINVMTLLVNFIDFVVKSQELFIWEISEDTLHFFTLLGGAPATVTAMILLKHNMKNPSYQEAFFTWCVLSCLWMIFVLFIVYSYQQVFLEFLRDF